MVKKNLINFAKRVKYIKHLNYEKLEVIKLNNPLYENKFFLYSVKRR